MRVATVRPRFGGSKVKSGCRTCKSRHVKCDESLPSCQRCVKGGRDCAYGVAGSSQKRAQGQLRMVHYVVKVPKNPSSFPNWTSPEKRSLDFFQRRTSTEIAGCIVSELWSTFILQAAHCHPAIRHAVIALSALHETFQQWNSDPSTDFAIQQYSKAIRGVSRLCPSKPSETLDVALLSYMLFAAFESLRGYYKSALTHIYSGMKLIAAEESGHGDVKGRSPSWRLIQPIFVCLDTQAMEVCDDLLPSSGVTSVSSDPLLLPQAFNTIEEACTSFTIYRNHVLRFFQRYEGLLDPGLIAEAAQNVRAEQVKLAQYFRAWCNVFESADFPAHHPQVLIIQIYMTVVTMIATLVPSPDEAKWDKSYNYFDRVVTLGEEFVLQYVNDLETIPFQPGPIRSKPFQQDFHYNDSKYNDGSPHSTDRSTEVHSLSSKTSLNTASFTSISGNSVLPSERDWIRHSFTLGHGIVTPLYTVCTRRRDPYFRRRALRILQICNRREGIWDSAQSARVAEQVIQIEETAAGGVVTDASHIPSHARIQELETSFGPGKPGKLMYRMNGANTPITTVEYLQDGGSLATWEAREEEGEDIKCRSFFSTRFTILPRLTLLS